MDFAEDESPQNVTVIDIADMAADVDVIEMADNDVTAPEVMASEYVDVTVADVMAEDIDSDVTVPTVMAEDVDTIDMVAACDVEMTFEKDEGIIIE